MLFVMLTSSRDFGMFEIVCIMLVCFNPIHTGSTTLGQVYSESRSESAKPKSLERQPKILHTFKLIQNKIFQAIIVNIEDFE